MNPHPITPEVEEFVKWMYFKSYYLALYEGKWTYIRYEHEVQPEHPFTTAELFDWWMKNVKK